MSDEKKRTQNPIQALRAAIFKNCKCTSAPCEALAALQQVEVSVRRGADLVAMSDEANTVLAKMRQSHGGGGGWASTDPVGTLRLAICGLGYTSLYVEAQEALDLLVAQRDGARRDLSAMGAELEARRREAATAQGRAAAAESERDALRTQRDSLREEANRAALELTEARSEVEQLRYVGGMMSNLCFNLAQPEHSFGSRERADMDRLRKQWDAIPRGAK